MADKELGYVELEWTCPICKTRNPGTLTTCGGCGAAQPRNVKFEQPAVAELVVDKEKIERAEAGPDIQCGFCGARNPATAKVCGQCGADLAAGEARAAGDIVGAYSAAAPAEILCEACGMTNPASARVCVRCGAPLGKAVAPLSQPQAMATPTTGRDGGGGSTGRIFLLVAALVVVTIVAFVFLSFRTSATIAVVQEARWERTIAIEGLAPVERRAWEDQIPAGASVVGCQPELRYIADEPQPGAREVCGTPYTVDTGTGMGRVVQECEYEVFDDMCTYTELEWNVIDRAVMRDTGFQLAWPAITLGEDQRLGDRSERLLCVVKVGSDSYTFTARTEAEYEQCEPGSRWQIEVNTFGNVVSAQRIE